MSSPMSVSMMTFSGPVALWVCERAAKEIKQTEKSANTILRFRPLISPQRSRRISASSAVKILLFWIISQTRSPKSACAIPFPPSILLIHPMKTILSLSPAAQLETECMVAVVLDRGENARGEKDKPDVHLATADKALPQAAADLIASGDVSGKMFENSWLHKPSGLKAKRLLLIGGGKAKKFGASELRKVAGAAVRALKSRNVRSLAIAVPDVLPGDQSVRAIVEGAFIGDFDSDTYKSDHKDQKMDSLTVLAAGD